MLPVIASMIMGGLFKQSTNQLQAAQQAAGFGGAGNPLDEIIEQMMRQGGMGGVPGGAQPQQRQAPQQPADPFDNPFGKVLKDMFGGGAARNHSRSSAGPNRRSPRRTRSATIRSARYSRR